MQGVPAGDDTHRFRGRAKYASGHSLCVKGYFGDMSLVHLSTLNSSDKSLESAVSNCLVFV